MKLQQFSLVGTEDWVFDGENEYPVTTQAIEPVDDGGYYRAADVDALLARIREAVVAEREITDHVTEYLADTGNVGIPWHLEPERYRPALDALLNGVG